MRRLVTSSADDPVAKKERPGLLEYLKIRLGACTGNGSERSFHCHMCITLVGSESGEKKLGINIDKGVAFCFRCSFRAKNLEDLFRSLNNGALKMDEAHILRGETKLPKENLHDHLTRTLFADAPVVRLKPQRPPREAMPLFDPRWAPRCRRAIEYLAERRIHPDLFKQHRIHYCDDGVYANRLIFPITLDGKSDVYFTTRYCGDHWAKAKNPDNIEGSLRKSDIIWNYHGLKGHPLIAIGEGVISAMAFEAGGALLGKEISDEQIRLIADLVKWGLEEVVIALDADAGKYSERIHARIASRVPKASIIYFDHGDPDDRREDLAELLAGRKQPDLLSSVRSRLLRSK